MRISSNFDSGNIQVIQANSADAITLRINKDNQSEFYQWFHYKLETIPDTPHRMTIEDLKQSAYPDGWKEYQAVASYDRQEWFRVPTQFDGDNLVIEHTPECSQVYYAYFAPYSYERHQDLLAWAQISPRCQLTHLGETLDKRDLSLLTIGEPTP
ncbi:M14-type cytosolic carboxypeptidase [Dongshaea marina]|uniref:M14-type cytosolic carboxypeptidase n=1 Tax=Dongshaea marina TaxID=2047966 RepID=UPI001901130D|nr:M14-type cytosolic carboxypeptidase [Dongshaea marina]